LMRIREEHCARWWGALERLLRGFSLSIFEPEQIYSHANR
jgi:uncharacterized protein YPO0396